jgi:hypothetical protein
MATKSRTKPIWERSPPAKRKRSRKTTLTPGQKAEAKRAAKTAGRPYPNLVDNARVARKARKKKSSPRAAGKGAARAAAKGPAKQRGKGTQQASAKKKRATAAKRKRATGAGKTPARRPTRRSGPGSPKRDSARKTAGKSARAAERPRRQQGRATPSASRTRDPAGGLTAAGRAEFARRDGAHLKPGVKKATRDMTPEEMRRKGSWATRFYGRARLPPLVDADGKPTRFARSAHAWGEPVPRTEAAARAIAERGRALLAAYRRTRGKHAKGSSARIR